MFKNTLSFIGLVDKNYKPNFIKIISSFIGILLIISVYFLTNTNFKSNPLILLFCSIFFLPLFFRNRILTISLFIIIFFSSLTNIINHSELVLLLLAFFLISIEFLDNTWEKIHWSKTHSYIFFWFIIVVFSSLFTIDYQYFFRHFKYLIANLFLFIILVELIILSFNKKNNNVPLIFLNAMIVGSLFLSISAIYMIIKLKYYIIFTGGRPTGLVGDSNVMALLLNMSLALALFLYRISKSWFIRLFYLFSIIILTIGIFISLSRGGLLGLLFIFLIFIYQNRKSKLMWIIILLASVLVFFIWGELLLSRMNTLSEVGSTQDFSLYARIKLIKIGLINIMHSPLFGIGFGDFIESTYHYYSVSSIHYPVAHNTWLNVASETGLVGLFIYLSIFFSTWKILNNVKKHAKKNENEDNVFIAEALQISLISIAIPATFLSVHNKFFIFIFLAICIGSSYCLLNNGGKIEKRI